MRFVNRATYATLLLMCCGCAVGDVPAFKFVSVGKTPLYQYDNEKLQDLSAAAYDKHHALLGFDGGSNSKYPEVRLQDVKKLDAPATLVTRKVVQQDIEGATFSKGVFYVTSSLSQVNEDTTEYRIISALEFDEQWNVKREQSKHIRDTIMDALQSKLKDSAWFSRVASSFGKSGGLNVEGLSASHNGSDKLIFGLRSPLWGPLFGAETFGSQFSLEKGDAILIEVSDVFDQPKVTDIKTLALNGVGVRGMEYIESESGYLIIGGPVPKESNFSLWFYSPAKKVLKQIDVDRFDGLCRPESILSIPEERKVFILSEDSGNSCATSEYSYVELTY